MAARSQSAPSAIAGNRKETLFPFMVSVRDRSLNYHGRRERLDMLLDPQLAGRDSTPPFDDFRLWFEQVVDEVRPALVVCIARSALRLMQMHHVEDVLKDVAVVTQFTLPLLPDEAIDGRRILVFDNSVIYGSTLSGTHDYLVSRGGIPTCATYIADSASFYGDGPGLFPSPHAVLPIRVKHRLSPALVVQHHDTVIQSILRTSLDYNPEFSSTTFLLADSDAATAAILPLVLGQHPQVRRIADVSSAVSVGAGVHKYSLLLRGCSVPMFASANVAVTEHSKGRVCFDRQTNGLRLTSLAQVILKHGTDPSEVEFADATVNGYWRRLRYARRPQDELWPQAVFRLITAVASTVLNARLARPIPRLLDDHYRCQPGQFNLSDLSVVITDDNAVILSELFAALVECPAESTSAVRPVTSALISPSRRSRDERQLADSISQLWSRKPLLAPVPGESSYEALGKTFLALHEVTDSDDLRKQNPRASRLRVGLSISTVLELFSEQGLTHSPDDLSVALDVCIDHGQAVPRVLRDDHLWYRAFYSGENRNPIDPLQCKGLFHKAYSAHMGEKASRPRLTPFLFNKLCAVLKDVVPRLPISTRFKTFGKVAYVESDDIVEWMTSSRGAPYRLERLDAKDTLIPNPHFVSAVEPSWSPQESRDFADGFSFVATAFESASTDEVLLISTCRTHRHSYCAMAAEAHQWIGSVRGFSDFIDEIDAALQQGSGRSETLTRLYYCCRYIDEVSKKHSVFASRFERLRGSLKTRFTRQGSAATRFWEHFVVGKDLLNGAVVPEIEDRAKLLLPLVALMRWLTAYSARILDSSASDDDGLAGAFRRHGTSLERDDYSWVLQGSARDAAVEYNRCRSALLAGGSVLLTPIQVPDPSSVGTLKDALPNIRQCYAEIRSAVLQLCPRYQVEEGNEFEFAPDCTRRILSDGTIERYLPDQYVLALDVIGSTDSDAGTQLKNSVLAILDGSAAQGVRFATAGDDKFVACHSSAKVMWDLAVAISVDGAMLSADSMMGTRKGLFFGGVTLQTKPDGRILLIDTATPHVIPRAVGTIDGVKKSELAKQCGDNAVISVDQFAAQRAVRDLSLTLENAEKVEVSAKHYRASCYVFPIARQV